jgi:AraC-like DNA-binding protein
MLANRTGTVTEIAYEVGFSNLSWFAKSFKEYFGIQPSDYRKEAPEK